MLSPVRAVQYDSLHWPRYGPTTAQSSKPIYCSEINVKEQNAQTTFTPHSGPGAAQKTRGPSDLAKASPNAPCTRRPLS